MSKVIEFDGGYGRTGTVEVEVAICCACKKSKLCLVIDQSEKEYEPGSICNDCAAAMFAEQTRLFSIVGNPTIPDGMAVFVDKDGKEVGRIIGLN